MSTSKAWRKTLVILALADGMVGMVAGAMAFVDQRQVGLIPAASSVTVVWLLCSIVCDATIILAINHLLLSVETGMAESNTQASLLHHLIAQVGAATAVAAASDILLCRAPGMLMSRFYAAIILIKLLSYSLLSVLVCQNYIATTHRISAGDELRPL